MQNYKVVFSDLAIADLNDIVQYITENESYTCAKDEYASTPDLTVRFITKWNYKLDYTVQDDIVIIAAIFHCSRNPIRLKDRF